MPRWLLMRKATMCMPPLSAATVPKAASRVWTSQLTPFHGRDGDPFYEPVCSALATGSDAGPGHRAHPHEQRAASPGNRL